MADLLMSRNDRVRLEAEKGQVWAQPDPHFPELNHGFVAGRVRWDRFFRYWPLRARERLI